MYQKYPLILFFFPSKEVFWNKIYYFQLISRANQDTALHKHSLKQHSKDLL